MTNSGSLGVIWRVLRDYILVRRWSFIVLMICTVISGKLSALFIRYLSPAVNSLFLADLTLYKVLRPCCVVCVLGIVVGILEYIRTFLVGYLGYNAICIVQSQLFKNLIFATPERLNNLSVSEVLSRFTNDLLLLKGLVVHFFASCIRQCVLFMFFVYEIFRMEFCLSLCISVIFIVTGVLLNVIGRKMRDIQLKVQQNLYSYNKYIENVYTDFHLMDMNKRLDLETKSNFRIGEILKKYKAQSAYNALAFLSVEFVSSVCVAGIIFYMGIMMLTDIGVINPGRVVTFLLSLMSVARPIRGIMHLNHSLQSGIAAATRIFKILDSEEDKKDK
ncbi:ABC transporter transmembrane domain-containing protein [Candidatus Sneabacter namystus]|uniref:ABC transporter ATP-binding protein n=1 Tax=Candidatus Sneabacter namystus TaxID=2601646 RepID=A0A5C0UJ46_9RICK|nr:ABC transporter ATP-binding protein [Candidatus Sneabacter namystus]QEK39819.1 ABC transporter ATP-binding protein [Candidatus Sneabacter namystus]